MQAFGHFFWKKAIYRVLSKKNTRPCLCSAQCERTFGGNPLAGGPKYNKKSAPKDAFPIVHCAL